NLSARAVSALRNFRRIILRLGELAKSGEKETGRWGDAETRGRGDAETGRWGDAETGGLGEAEIRQVQATARESEEDSASPRLPVSESPRPRVSPSPNLPVSASPRRRFSPSPAAPSLSLSSSSPVSDIVKTAILDTGYENALKSENTDEAEARLENLQELVNAAVDYDNQGIEGLREFIDHSALVSDADQYKRDAPVTLMTAHSAKGLEFPLVFIVGLEDGLFPHSRSATDPEELEEERRLCYVAMTRAERYLYVTHAMKRRVYGEELASEPSQFLNEMPLELLEDLSLGKSWLSFARGSSTIEYEQGEYRKERKKFSGKTYDSVDSIAEFFKQRNQQMGRPASETRHGTTANRQPAAGTRSPASSSRPSTTDTQLTTSSEFAPGSYVRHAKYGRGLVLHREGAGDSLKLTVTFPGYGQKKLVQKYAGLEKA
ncbi:MAG TPA: 3'-5' exonuclease, partial [Pyrinomonadaceae bacterium]|nr:3'-5' exonuclease [Pyrinomonadaceae bacterium]